MPDGKGRPQKAKKASTQNPNLWEPQALHPCPESPVTLAQRAQLQCNCCYRTPAQQPSLIWFLGPDSINALQLDPSGNFSCLPTMRPLSRPGEVAFRVLQGPQQLAGPLLSLLLEPNSVIEYILDSFGWQGLPLRLREPPAPGCFSRACLMRLIRGTTLRVQSTQP